MPNKDTIARLLASAHLEMDPSINRVVRLIADGEDEVREPVKLLEVNPATCRIRVEHMIDAAESISQFVPGAAAN